jgi:hypothetical protein
VLTGLHLQCSLRLPPKPSHLVDELIGSLLSLVSDSMHNRFGLFFYRPLRVRFELVQPLAD